MTESRRVRGNGGLIRALPDGVFSATAVNLAILVQDDVGFQVSVIVVCRVVVGYDPRWDPQAAQDCREEGQEMEKRSHVVSYNRFWLWLRAYRC